MCKNTATRHSQLQFIITRYLFYTTGTRSRVEQTEVSHYVGSKLVINFNESYLPEQACCLTLARCLLLTVIFENQKHRLVLHILRRY